MNVLNINRIKEIRKMKKISPAEIASLIGVTPSTYHNWLAGGGKIGCEQVVKMAEALGVDLPEILHDDVKKRLGNISQVNDGPANYGKDNERNYLKIRIQDLEALLEDKNQIIRLLQEKQGK